MGVPQGGDGVGLDVIGQEVLGMRFHVGVPRFEIRNPALEGRG